MMNDLPKPGARMASEIAQAPAVFSSAARKDLGTLLDGFDVSALRTIFTVARGSSDAAALMLSYLFMRHLKIPMTSLPPSTFSVYGGVSMPSSAGLVISQSGASDDLVACAQGIRQQGGQVVAITNQPGSAVEAASNVTLPIGAGPELAIPATKSVIGAIAAGQSLLGALVPDYRENVIAAADAMDAFAAGPQLDLAPLQSGLLRANHVYVIGRGEGYGAAQEVALKLKETAALHAEAYSASEVLHGPLQLATNPLFVLILDTGAALAQQSLDQAERRFVETGAEVFRLRPPQAEFQCPAAMAAMLLYMVYPVVLNTTLALGLDPDTPSALSKVTKTS